MPPFSVKTELEQGGDKPLSYAVLGVFVDVSVFKGGKDIYLTSLEYGALCYLAAMPSSRHNGGGGELV